MWILYSDSTTFAYSESKGTSKEKSSRALTA